MRDRDLASAALLAAIVCCGSMALLAGLLGGVALVWIGQFTAVSTAGLGVVVVIAWRLDRRTHRRSCPADSPGPSAYVEEAVR
jgi:hypothetical protein